MAIQQNINQLLTLSAAGAYGLQRMASSASGIREKTHLGNIKKEAIITERALERAERESGWTPEEVEAGKGKIKELSAKYEVFPEKKPGLLGEINYQKALKKREKGLLQEHEEVMEDPYGYVFPFDYKREATPKVDNTMKKIVKADNSMKEKAMAQIEQREKFQELLRTVSPEMKTAYESIYGKERTEV